MKFTNITTPKNISEDCFELDKFYNFDFIFMQASWLILLNENGFLIDEYISLDMIMLCIYVVPFLFYFYQSILIRLRMGVKAKVL
jgi:hypothetical protein